VAGFSIWTRKASEILEVIPTEKVNHFKGKILHIAGKSLLEVTIVG